MLSCSLLLDILVFFASCSIVKPRLSNSDSVLEKSFLATLGFVS